MAALEYASVPQALLQNPPVASGELSVFELKVALHLVAMAYMQRTVDRNARIDARVQQAIDRVKNTTDDGGEIRRAARLARKKVAASERSAWPTEVEIHITGREMLRALGLADSAPPSRLHSALDRLMTGVELPNRAPQLPALLADWRKGRDGLVLTISITQPWFPIDETRRRKVGFPLPTASRGQAANVLALYLLSHTWRTSGHRSGATRQAIMKRLGVTRWRAVERAVDGLNQHRRKHGSPLRWRMRLDDDKVTFKQVVVKAKAEAPNLPAEVCSRATAKEQVPAMKVGLTKRAIVRRRLKPEIAITDFGWEQSDFGDLLDSGKISRTQFARRLESCQDE